MKLNESIALKLIEEMKMPGRECIYDFTHSSHKNNHRKQIIWTAISNSIGMNRSECQALWKSLGRRHRAAVNKNCRSGDERMKVKGVSELLITEMDYFQRFWKDKKPKVSNYTDANNDIFHRVDSKVDDAENELNESIKSLYNLAAKLLKGSTEKRDPFFLAMEEEFSKVSESQKSALKVKLLALIVEHQQ